MIHSILPGPRCVIIKSWVTLSLLRCSHTAPAGRASGILTCNCTPIGIVYNVQIVTGNIRGAGTNSKIHIVMHGSKGTRNGGKVMTRYHKPKTTCTSLTNQMLLQFASDWVDKDLGNHLKGTEGSYCFCFMWNVCSGRNPGFFSFCFVLFLMFLHRTVPKWLIQ